MWISCRALARGYFEDTLLRVAENSDSPYVRATVFKSLGLIKTRSSAQKLASILDDSELIIEKLMASEALIELNIWQDIESERIIEWMKIAMDDPYILKNMIILFGQAYPNIAGENIASIEDMHLHPVVTKAINYLRTKPLSENLLLRPESDIFKKYRANSYPIIEELLSDKASYDPAGY